MKNTRNNMNNRIIRGGGLLLALIYSSLIGVGFSNWITATNSSQDVEINAQIADVVISPSLINDYKFAFGSSNGLSSFNSTKTDNNNITSNKSYESDSLSIELLANISSNEMFYNQEYDAATYNNVYVKLNIKNSNGSLVNRNEDFTDDSLVFPKNYSNFSYSLNKVEGSIDTYNIALKSKREISLFYIAFLDQGKSPYSLNSNIYMVPINFSFNIKSSKLALIDNTSYVFDFYIWLE